MTSPVQRHPRVRSLWIALVALGLLSARPENPPEDRVRRELMDADRAFAAAARARGLDGWMEYMTADAARLPKLGAKAVRGKEAIRKADKAIFSDPKRQLVWEPTEAGAFADGRHGFTTGKYRVIQKEPGGKEKVVGSGAYLTWWRKERDGKWRVILDTGNPDPPAAATKPRSGS
jgi:uncharacterized protein (TIGR02246 family)